MLNVYRSIRELHMTHTAREIAKLLGIHTTTVHRKAKKMGLSFAGNQRKAERNQSCNIHFFDEWSPVMAYILGFIFADGSVRQSTVSIEVTESDEEILNFIKRKTKSVLPLANCRHKNSTTKPSLKLRLNSKVMVAKLLELGVFPTKTFRDDPFPVMPPKMRRHFIRGYFDGDGCVSWRSDRNCKVEFIGTRQFIKTVRNILVKRAGMLWKKTTSRKGKRATWSYVSWTHQDDLRAFASYIYPEGKTEFSLKRKKDKLLEWLSVPRDSKFCPFRYRRDGQQDKREKSCRRA